jgi:hypothetical protein
MFPYLPPDVLSRMRHGVYSGLREALLAVWNALRRPRSPR